MTPPPCFIIPPHMIEAIAARGTKRQRERALLSLQLSERLRGRRDIAGLLPSGLGPACAEKQRTVYDAGHRTRGPYAMVRGEGEKAGRDPAANEAYDGAGATFDFYEKHYARCSIDGRGMRLDSVVHFDRAYDNAFWDGTQMIYGDGDGELFNRFTVALDVIGHELTHGVTQNEAALEYSGQPGALNEHFSDVFGSLAKQALLGQRADQASWLIGEGLFTDRVEGKAIRSMKAPGTAYDDDVLGKDPQPAHMRGFVRTSSDNGGVHINSGIPNRAFFETAARIGGFAWQKAGAIWYSVLTQSLRPQSDFGECARKTVEEAGRQFGQASQEQKAVAAGWKAVGVKIKGAEAHQGLGPAT